MLSSFFFAAMVGLYHILLYMPGTTYSQNFFDEESGYRLDLEKKYGH